MRFRSQLKVMHGTDRWTDRQQSSLHNAPPYEGGIIRTKRYFDRF